MDASATTTLMLGDDGPPLQVQKTNVFADRTCAVRLCAGPAVDLSLHIPPSRHANAIKAFQTLALGVADAADLPVAEWDEIIDALARLRALVGEKRDEAHEAQHLGEVTA